MIVMYMLKIFLGIELVIQIKIERVDGGEYFDVILISFKCIVICGKFFKGCFCVKILVVNIYKIGNFERLIKVYVMFDEYCNRSFISFEVLDILGIYIAEIQYILIFCLGSY